LPGAPSLASLQAREAQRRIWLRLNLSRSPRTLWGIFTRVLRVNAALALLAPTVCGAMLSWWEVGHFDQLTFWFSLGAMLLVTLGANSLGEYRDYKSAQSANVTTMHDPLITGYGLMVHGKIAPAIALNVGYMLLTAGALCCLWLALLSGWPSLFFSILTLVLVYSYVNPPLRYAYQGWGIGEVGIFLGYGLLPFLNSYLVQGERLSGLALLVGAAFGLLVTVILGNYNLIYERRDWLMRKRTLVVELKPPRALDCHATLILLAYVTILLIVSVAYLPLVTLLTIAALPTALGAFSQLRRNQLAPEDSYQLYKTTVNATIWTGLLFSAALIGDKMF
jgi:1,4-dihydroxy-2-naphthoate octaprenyltransferase